MKESQTNILYFRLDLYIVLSLSFHEKNVFTVLFILS